MLSLETVLATKPFFLTMLLYLFEASLKSSSETQGQIVGARERINGRKYMARRKVKNGEKSSSRLGSQLETWVKVDKF